MKIDTKQVIHFSDDIFFFSEIYKLSWEYINFGRLELGRLTIRSSLY